ncbi:MAG: pyruvate, phosphate dikinase, partial [Novosphingobium sp.]|nr:pyruvate, phosphate dikinase [Novosphingobium sp.]
MKWVEILDGSSLPDRDRIGGKAWSVARMAALGLEVPPAFVIRTDACLAYLDEGAFPGGLEDEIAQGLSWLEERTGREFGAGRKRLLLSIRSGAAISMPGMMDTVLNLGLNDETVQGLASQTDDDRFAFDAYRRFIAMFANIVMGVEYEKFERVLSRIKAQSGASSDTDLTVEQLREVIAAYKRIIFAEQHGIAFPEDASEQLRMAIAAVFDSWMRPRAIHYRRVNRIPDDLGTAVNVQAMVFGNMGWQSGTGVAFTRNPSTGKREFYGEYLLNAQGEDVVAGLRTPEPISHLHEELPEVYEQLGTITQRLERHYRDMQDIEFTVERGKLWMLQTRRGKRTGAAAVKIAVDMVDEGMIDTRTALARVSPDQLDQLLHPMVDPDAPFDLLAEGLPASPGAAQGRVVFDPDDAEALNAEGHKVILVRHETSPDDFHGMVASQAIVTARGGMTSHAAVVARGMGTPCVAGASDLQIDYGQQQLVVGDRTVLRGDWITVDGSTGRVLSGQVPTVQPELGDDFHRLMGWADEVRRLGVRANADNAEDAARARDNGAEGIGLCRTEHMFLGDRLPVVRRMILAATPDDEDEALEELRRVQREDFEGILAAMDGLPVTVRLLDPPLHEFLPKVADLELKAATDGLTDQEERLRRAALDWAEENPMLGIRGVRLAVLKPGLYAMQVRALLDAVADRV